jgi:NAD(P)H dehydrogenase (quinone)
MRQHPGTCNKQVPVRGIIMNRILVTGANGNLGKRIIESLLKLTPKENIIAMVRDTKKVNELIKLGIEVREADYTDYNSLVNAFKDVQKVFLVSAVAFTDRISQHINAINAAKVSGVKHVVYSSIQRKKSIHYVMPQVTESDLATEYYLKESGLNYTILHNPLYLDASILLFLGKKFQEEGIKMPTGKGRVSAATISDIAEASAIVLMKKEHENKEYTLTVNESLSFEEIANMYKVSFEDISTASYIEERVKEGWPKPGAEFAAQWLEGIRVGAFEEISHDLEIILGRKAVTLKKYLEGQH